MNYYERPTPLQEKAYTEARQHFAEHLKQFKANCDAIHNIEANLPAIARDAIRAALQSSGRIIQTDDGTQWQHAVDLTKITSVCHRRTAAGLEFAAVECLPLKSGEMKDVLNSGHDVSEVLQAFARDQRQVLNLWKNDVTAQIREHLEEKYPHQDMNIVVESFDIKLARDISRRETIAQNQSHGMRV
jgi:urease gamma subunit